jgi:hypothetical protein
VYRYPKVNPGEVSCGLLWAGAEQLKVLSLKELLLWVFELSVRVVVLAAFRESR